ncbi:MAG: anti-sigma factor, partial [Acidimicrobiales bacterium]
LDGELEPAEAAAVAVHLDGCSACGLERDEVEAARRAVRALPRLEAPPGVLRARPTVHIGDLLSARLDGELSPDLLEGIEAHLGACPACFAEDEEVAWARTALRSLPPLDPPEGVLRSPWAWPVSAHPISQPRPRSRGRQLVAATAAVAAAGAGVLGLVGRAGPADTSRPSVASFVSQHSTSSPGPDAVSGLAPAAMPVSFTR